jgi:hypothetical protein
MKAVSLYGVCIFNLSSCIIIVIHSIRTRWPVDGKCVNILMEWREGNGPLTKRRMINSIAKWILKKNGKRVWNGFV